MHPDYRYIFSHDWFFKLHVQLNACKEKSHREKEEVIATMNAEVL
jgi:hypothetical protein